jgi:hypothetical protein
MNRRTVTMRELIQNNKREIISNKKEMERIERKLDEKTINNQA